jgi:hypothetical protein
VFLAFVGLAVMVRFWRGGTSSSPSTDRKFSVLIPSEASASEPLRREEVREGEAVAPVSGKTAVPARLQGRARLPESMAKRRDSLDLAVAGLEVGPGGRSRKVRRDYPGAILEDGSYSIDDLGPGTYALQILMDGRPVSELRRIRWAAGSAPEPADFDFSRSENGVVTGTVRAGTTGELLSAARVTLSNEIGVLTDSEGRYVLEDVPPGPAVVEATHPRFDGQQASLVIAARGNTMLDFQLPPGGTLVVTVRDPVGHPVPQANVTLQGRFGGRAHVTNSSGQTRFSSLRTTGESYEIRVAPRRMVSGPGPIGLVPGGTLNVDVVVE